LKLERKSQNWQMIPVKKDVASDALAVFAIG
jgi:hypothetical protein